MLGAVELLRKKISGSRVFGFKDPRVATLLPFWKEAFVHSQLKVSYVLTLRHPLSVCKSLAKRDGLDFEKSYLLWLNSVINSFVGTVGESRVLVDYDRLIRSPEDELSRIAQKLQLQIDLVELEKFKLEFLDNELRHTFYQLSDLTLGEEMPPLVREVYSKALDVATDKLKIEDIVFENTIKQWSDELSRQKTTLLLADKLESRIVTRNQALAERESQVQALTAQVAERNQQVEMLAAQVAERNQVLAAQAAEKEALTAQLRTAEEEILKYSLSKSWRITQPLRQIAQFLSKGKQCLDLFVNVIIFLITLMKTKSG